MKIRTYNIPYKRKRQGKTNYKKRLRLLLSKKPRLVIRPSLKYIDIQFIEYHPNGDHVLLSINSKQLEKYGWNYCKNNIPASYLIGLLAGTKAKEKGIKEAILDIGLYSSIKGSKIFACLKGASDSGLNVPYSKDIIPSDKRIKGEHIAEYASKLKKEEKYEKVFSGYSKLKADPIQITAKFEEVKNKIIKVK